MPKGAAVSAGSACRRRSLRGAAEVPLSLLGGCLDVDRSLQRSRVREQLRGRVGWGRQPCTFSFAAQCTVHERAQAVGTCVPVPWPW